MGSGDTALALVSLFGFWSLAACLNLNRICPRSRGTSVRGNAANGDWGYRGAQALFLERWWLSGADGRAGLQRLFRGRF